MHFNRFLALAAAIAAPAAALAPLYEDREPSVTPIPGKFVVKLQDDISTDTAREVESLMDEVDYFYNVTSFKGLAGKLDDAALESVREHPGVDYVERDMLIPACSYVTQHEAPWGLGRISHKGPRNFTDNTTYVYEASAGEGVCAYVLDTGVLVDHEAAKMMTTLDMGPTLPASVSLRNQEGALQCVEISNYANTISVGGATYGVAKKVRLYSVKVLRDPELGDPELGSSEIRSNQVRSRNAIFSSVLEGMAFVANDSQTRNCPNGTVANISWLVSFSKVANDLGKGLLNAGVFVAVGAGNDHKESSRWSPASEPSLCTVGATDKNNLMPNWSSHGSAVDILTPGVDILSAWNTSTSATEIRSGTSMAAPHIAGLAACLLASGHKDPKTLCDYMVRIASPVITDPDDHDDTVNIVSFNGNPKG